MPCCRRGAIAPASQDNTAKPRLGYVLPIYEARSGAHYAHIPRLLEALAPSLDLELIVWRSADEPDLPGVRYVGQPTATSPLRRWLELRRMIRARVRDGCRRWFVRGSAPLALAAELAGAKTIYWLCGVDEPTKNLAHWLQKAFGRLAIRGAAWVATAPGWAHYNRDKLGVPLRKAVLLDNDIDLERFQPLSTEERDAVRQRLEVSTQQPLLLYVHRLTTARGADCLLPVLDACADAGLDVTLLAVGGPGDRSGELADYAAQHPDRLRLLGARPNDELPELYAAADVFLMPSHGEGFPRVVLEAMACGTPLVATDVGTVSTVLPAETHDAALAPVGDPLAFAAKVVALLRSSDEQAALAERLTERAQYYRTERVAERYCQELAGLAAD